LTAAVKSREDHGYTLDLGIRDVSGFLPFKGLESGTVMHVGALVDITVVKATANGRISTVSADSAKFATSYVGLFNDLKISTQTVTLNSFLKYHRRRLSYPVHWYKD
jgi:hypothetical protein